MRLITDAGGNKDKRTAYKPFGEFTDIIDDVTAPEETKGWIGERYDEDARLQYLNARYYDPELGLFIQPDWWEVTKAGVGTNRYSYSFNDPVNAMDPGGNATSGEAAYIADDVYNADGEDFDENFPNYLERMSAEESAEYFGGGIWEDSATGFRARAYRNKNTGEIVIAFAGSKNRADWGNNFNQGLTGESPQYRQAREVAETVLSSGKLLAVAEPLSFAGHSLGGGLAIEAALQMSDTTLRNAKTFNGAGISVKLGEVGDHLGMWRNQENKDITNHYIRFSLGGANDLLSALNAITPGMYRPGKEIAYPSRTSGIGGAHVMSAFKGLIDGFN